MDAAVQQLTDAFQCPVCYELICSAHKSRCLPCGHGNVCEKDLQALWRQAKQTGTPFTCPSQGCALANCPAIDKLPYNWAFISAGDSMDDLRLASESCSGILSGPAKRAMQLVESTAGFTCRTPAADVITTAASVYSALTQSFASPDSGRAVKPTISGANARQMQEAEGRITVVKRIMGGQGVEMNFMKLFIVSRDRNVFDWIQVALLDSISESSASAGRRRDAVLHLRLLRTECLRAAEMFRQEQDAAIDTLQALLASPLQPFAASTSTGDRLHLCFERAHTLQDLAARMFAFCEFACELGGSFVDSQPQQHVFVSIERLCYHVMQTLDGFSDLDAAQRSERKAALSACDAMAEKCKRRYG